MVAKSTEIRMDVTPWYVPQSVVISPSFEDRGTGIYGVAFNPIGVGLTLTPSPLRFSLGAGAMLKYMFIHSDTLPSPTHFLRPGIELNADFEFPIVPDVFYLSLGWASQLYIPEGRRVALGGVVLHRRLHRRRRAGDAASRKAPGSRIRSRSDTKCV